MPYRRQLPDTEHALVLTLARKQREIDHSIAVLVEDRLPAFVVVAPGANDQKIEIVVTAVKDDEAEPARFERRLREIGTRQAVTLSGIGLPS